MAMAYLSVAPHPPLYSHRSPIPSSAQAQRRAQPVHNHQPAPRHFEHAASPHHPNPAPQVGVSTSPSMDQHYAEYGPHYGYMAVNGVPQGPLSAYPPDSHHHYPALLLEDARPYSLSPSQTVSSYHAYGTASAPPVPPSRPKKHWRATEACEPCRQRKQKCDEGEPCSPCKEQKLTCHYRDPPPAKTVRTMEKVLEFLQAHSSALADLNGKMENFDQRLRRVEHASALSVAREQSATPLSETSAERNAELSDHRTAPHKLMFLWPSIRSLLKDAGVECCESYVMEAEDRGILQIHTAGEGIEEHDDTQSPLSGGGISTTGVLSPPDEVWDTAMSNTSSFAYHHGALKPDGPLDLDVDHINMLHECYLRSFHRMHPFLDKGRLRKLVDRFIYLSCPGQSGRTSAHDEGRPSKRQRLNVPVDAGGRDRTGKSPSDAIVWLVLALGRICLHKGALPGVVRNPDQSARSNGADSPISVAREHSPSSAKSTPRARSASRNANRFSGVASQSRRNSYNSYSRARNLDVIPGLAYYAKAAEILGEQSDGNDLAHVQMFLLAGLYKGQLARVKESMSWISMAGRAILILLDQHKLYNENYWNAYGDGNMREQYEKAQSRIKTKRHSLIVLASWTCLQLESDILAEVKLPSSGIQSIENMLLMPHVPDEEANNHDLIQETSHEGMNNIILLFYTAQTFLRKRLNQVHKELYGDQCLHQTVSQVREMLSEHENILSYWRETLPAPLKWSDDDPPPTDILDARLRAKYWGARYIINRPFLDYALHIMPQMKKGRSIDSIACNVHGKPRDKAEIHLFKAIAALGDREIWEAAQRCIDAAMHSTVALDGVPSPLIVTNIHGTAHAQFGNVLVLSAVYYNDSLRQLVDCERLKSLLDRTIKFLNGLSAISPTCFEDFRILTDIRKLLFEHTLSVGNRLFHDESWPTSLPSSATASFTSATTAPSVATSFTSTITAHSKSTF